MVVRAISDFSYGSGPLSFIFDLFKASMQAHDPWQAPYKMAVVSHGNLIWCGLSNLM